ncbi:MAG: TonB family protein [Pseudomonadota bacterium]
MRALGWSLGLHALVLGLCSGALPLESTGIAPAEPLQASLRAQPDAVAQVAVSAAPVAAPAPVRYRPQPQQVLRPVLTEPDAVPSAPTFTETAGSEPAVPAAVGGVPSTPTETKAVTVALADARETRGPDAAGLRQYRLALAGEARRYRNYPEAARREGIAGTAEVRISVSAGIARHTELARSSGYDALDSAALEMLRAAAARTLLPESLRGQEFAVLLPVVFNVEE